MGQRYGAVDVTKAAIFATTVMKTEADDGTAFVVDTELTVMAAGSADFRMKLPPTAGLKIGTRVYVLSVSNPTYWGAVAVDGTDASDKILSLGSTSAPAVTLYNNSSIYVFVYIGTLPGAPTWLAFADDDTTNVARPTARVATTGALPSNNGVEGTNSIDETMEAVSNGQLTIDGIPLSNRTATHTNGVLVKNQATAAENGLWQVLEPGDAGTKWKFRRRADWNQSNHGILGSTVAIEEGAANGDKIFRINAAQYNAHGIADFSVLG